MNVLALAIYTLICRWDLSIPVPPPADYSITEFPLLIAHKFQNTVYVTATVA
jgi:hypothetical protein